MHNTMPVTTSAVPTVTSGGGGTLYLVLIQVTSRAFTFLGNQFLLRFLSPSLLGLAVQLELLSVTVLYFSRESLRVALQRQPTGGNSKANNSSISQSVINLAYFAVLVGLLTSVGFGYAYLHNSSLEVLNSIDFWLAFKLYGAATLIELLAEPCFVIIQQHALYKARARAETIAAMSRCVAACISTLTMHHRHVPASVLPFAIGQFFYAITLIVTYLAAVLPLTKVERFSLLPRIITTDVKGARSSSFWLGLFSKPVLSLTAAFYAQSVFKLLLTQGDALILSFLTDLKSQGAFALASNYGGLLSRLIFQPVEESSRNVFGQLLNLTQGNESASTVKFDSTSTSEQQVPNSPSDTGNHNNSSISVSTSSDTISKSKNSHSRPINPPTSKNNLPQQQQPATRLSQALTHLSTTLHLYTLFSLPLVSILPPLLPSLTRFILSAQWRSHTTINLLTAYLYYLPFIAVNGILDAFVTTVATPAQLRTQSLAMAGVTGIYGMVAWMLMAPSANAAAARAWLGAREAVGSHGLVLANMVNMALRIVWSVWFVSTWVRTRQPGAVKALWKSCVPSAGCVVVAIAIGGGLRRVLPSNDSSADEAKSFLGLQGLSLEDVGYVSGGVVVLGSIILVSERQFLLDLVMSAVPERLAVKIRPYLPRSSVKQE